MHFPAADIDKIIESIKKSVEMVFKATGMRIKY